MEYYTILTDAGRALEAAALAGEKSFTLSMCALGDGTGTPDPAATQLRHEVWRGPLSSLSRDADNPARLVMEAHVPPKDGGFIIREFGIYTDEGVLFAIGNQPESYKPTPAEGSGIELTIRTICTVSSAVSVTLQIDPSIVMASQKYVDEKVASSEAALKEAIDAASVMASSALPQTNGEAAAGSSREFSRGDHVHPVDPSRAAAVHTHGIDQISGLRAELDEVIRLSEATTFYVRQNGSDENDGRAPETAVRSFERIYKILRAVDSRGYNVTVDIGPGTWGDFTVPQPISIANLYLRGAGSDITTLTRPDRYGVAHYAVGCYVYLRGMTITDCVYSVDARRHAVVIIENDIKFGPASDFHMLASYGGVISYLSEPPREWRISGSAKVHAYARYGGLIALPSSSITLEDVPNFSLGFARAEFSGNIYLQNCTFEGQATGRRYYVATNGVINTNRKDENYFPGDQVGEIYTGGQYV